VRSSLSSSTIKRRHNALIKEIDMGNAPSWVPIAIVLVLAAIGIGLVFFNMYQAASGIRSMREIKRQVEVHSANMDEFTTLQTRFEELKRQFFACSLSQAEKQEMWKRVDAALAPAVAALLSDSAEAGLVHLRRAVVEAQSLVTDFASETETE
jgi:hypothetical protein